MGILMVILLVLGAIWLFAEIFSADAVAKRKMKGQKAVSVADFSDGMVGKVTGVAIVAE